jgi:hypothetical protein
MRVMIENEKAQDLPEPVASTWKKSLPSKTSETTSSWESLSPFFYVFYHFMGFGSIPLWSLVIFGSHQKAYTRKGCVQASSTDTSVKLHLLDR